MKKLFCCLILCMTAFLCFADEEFEKVKAAAEQGDAIAQFFLAVMYNKGDGIPTDKKQAFYWYTKSAEKGHAFAQFNLAFMYYNGEGTLVDKKKAAYWVKQAYENGLNKAKDFWDAYELWKYQE